MYMRKTKQTLCKIVDNLNQAFNYVNDLNWDKDEEEITSALASITIAYKHILCVAEKQGILWHYFLKNK